VACDSGASRGRHDPHDDIACRVLAALTNLAHEPGPGVSYDFASSGPLTDVESFVHQSVYAMVLDDDSNVRAESVRDDVVALSLRVPVIVLRSCTSRTNLLHCRLSVLASLYPARFGLLPLIRLLRSQQMPHAEPLLPPDPSAQTSVWLSVWMEPFCATDPSCWESV
jgi:hypothetical protein